MGADAASGTGALWVFWGTCMHAWCTCWGDAGVQLTSLC